MGKEQDLLEASRSGQFQIIEKILNARIKKSGPLNLTSLRRLPGPNTTDPRNGFTCLHYAALNGHKDIVKILLEHGANPNLVDHNGSSPLHLASWTGDYEIVNMLISNNDLKAQINLANKDNETALHSACQYGHTAVVSLLLTHSADPFIPNVRQETPLDLAAQYGRLETIELLLHIRFNLLDEYLSSNEQKCQNQTLKTLLPHSPLHLASRNGHKSIVKLLLNKGFDVNYLTINGTALHEAVLCGKNEVVKLLLDAGTDVNMRNNLGIKVEELLNGLNTSVAKQTKKLIKEHIQMMADSKSSGNNNNSGFISPLSETISSTTIAASNSFGCDQEEDLTIVDSMLNDELLFSNAHHNDLDLDLLMVEQGEIECISPPPGYTDNNKDNEDKDDQLILPNCHNNDDDDHNLLDADCVSPSSSVFSTSIFSELASIFEDQLQHRSTTNIDCGNNKNNYQSNQIKMSNSFTLMGDLHQRATSSNNNQYFANNNDNNNNNVIQNFHQSFNNVAYQQDSPRRMTTPNLLAANDTQHMSSSFHSNNSEFEKYFPKKDQSDRESILVSSNYSISSLASSSILQGNDGDDYHQRSRPPKPPRKSIDLKIKSVDDSLTTVKNSHVIKSNNLVEMAPTTSNESNCSSDLADSDHSTSKQMDSVISNDQKLEKARSVQQTKLKQFSENKSKFTHEDNCRKLGPLARSPRHTPSPQISTVTFGHSIDDFYLLYDQAAREEYELEKQDCNNLINQSIKKYSNSMDLLKDENSPAIKKAETEDLSDEEVVTAEKMDEVKGVERQVKRTKSKINEPNTNYDPPSPNSAETEIIHAIEPLKMQFYDKADNSFNKCYKRKKTSELSSSCLNAKDISKKVSIANDNESNEKGTPTTATSFCHEHCPLTANKRDNWTLTDLADEDNGTDMKSIGILVQLDNKQTKRLINHNHSNQVRGQRRQALAAQQAPNRKNKQQNPNRSVNRQTNDEMKSSITAAIAATKKNDYFSSYCETLKFENKCEKENPFAGLCRGGLTPAKTKKQLNGLSNGVERKKKTVELSETRKSLRKQRNILSGRAESMSKLSKLSVYNGGEDITNDSKAKELSVSGTNTMITQPNNIYATLRKKKKSKSLNGDHHLSAVAINTDDNEENERFVSSTFKSINDQSQQIFLWLKEIEMQQFKDLLIQNGYDDLDFMDNNVMDDNDLIEIGIIQASHRELILNAAQELPVKTPKLTKEEIQTMSVAEWLTNLHLKQYVDIFHNNGLIELRNIKNIWEVELETMLEIEKTGHRRRILYSLLDFNCRDSIVSNNSDTLSPWLTDNASTCTNLEQDREQMETWKKAWKHSRNELVNGSCQYLVSYLGSTLVRELRGIDSTRASIGKLKKSIQNGGKILKILLSISCQGVQFKDTKSNSLICEHEIRNIHCICQDSEDLNYFAYITKDFESNNHYCHVFMSTQTDLVTEIILTLGQAFEIAYQIVLEQYNIHVNKQKNCQQQMPADNNVLNVNVTVDEKIQPKNTGRISNGGANSNNNNNNNPNYTTYVKGSNNNLSKCFNNNEAKTQSATKQQNALNLGNNGKQHFNNVSTITTALIKPGEDNEMVENLMETTLAASTSASSAKTLIQTQLNEQEISTKEKNTWPSNNEHLIQNKPMNNNNNIVINDNNHNCFNKTSINEPNILPQKIISEEQANDTIVTTVDKSNDDYYCCNVADGVQTSVADLPVKSNIVLNCLTDDKKQFELPPPPLSPPPTEQIYALVDKSRKTRKPLSLTSTSISITQATAVKTVIATNTTWTAENYDRKTPDDDGKENRPVPPVRSTSTTLSSNTSSTGTRPINSNPSNTQSQPSIKPKPPIRVQSMQQSLPHQKPEVSPKPKNLILNKSNTVQTVSLANNNNNNNNTKPVLARFCVFQQSQSQTGPLQSISHSNKTSTVNNDKTASSLTPTTFSVYHQKL